MSDLESTSDALLTEVKAADFLALSVKTLRTWRTRRQGPDFVKAGRAVRYRRRDLVAWLDRSTVRPSAESPAEGAGQ